MVATTDVQEESARGWDPLVRLTHWGVALAVVLNGLITEDGSDIHVWIGYAAIAFVSLRLLWGFVGPSEARFSSFPPSLSAAVDHVYDILAGKKTLHRSHNPLGTLAIYAMWACLVVVTATGVAMSGAPFDTASSDPISVAHADEGYDEERAEDEEDEEEETAEWLEETHELAANLLLFLSAVHVAGVSFESWRSRTNLVKSMVTGERRKVVE
jgi:cytochrome b